MTNAYWIRCDINGRGERWQLAVESVGDEYGEMYLFMESGFEDYRANFEEHEKVLIMTPDYRDATADLAGDVVQYMCDRCPETSYGTKPGNNCNDCPATPLKKALEME